MEKIYRYSRKLAAILDVNTRKKREPDVVVFL